MSLVGNLADLGLGEILQIVSLSRKSGVLTLQSKGRQGVVVFRFGQVIRANSSTIRYFLGEELLKRNLVEEELLNKALQVQQAGAYRERLGTILIKRFNIEAEKIESVVREQIERVVYSFFSWDEGSFEFELQDDVETIDDSKIDPLQFMLEQGLNPQFLAMEGSRIIDEKRNRGEALDDGQQFTETVSEEMPAAPVEPLVPEDNGTVSNCEIVIVEADNQVREAVSQMLLAVGSAVYPFTRSEEALITIDTLFRDGNRPAVIMDLIMPRMDGSGVLGGLELLELVHGNFPELHIIIISDFRNSDAERRIREIGADFILKPKGVDFSDPVRNSRFLAAIRESLQSFANGDRSESQPDDVNLGDELRVELGDIGEGSSSTVVPSTGISLLRGMLEELSDPSLGGSVILLLLRFASEFMSRAIVFTVKGDEIVGSGQFGVDLDGSPADSVIRGLKIPIAEDSLFSQVLSSKVPQKVAPDRKVWNDYIFEKIGGTPREAFLGPLLSGGEVVAVLYGDNYPENLPIGDTDSLEIFLSQAGVAMEKAELTERLKHKNPEAI